MPGVTKARRRARERRQTSAALFVLALALIASIGAWAVFFKAWTPAPSAQAPSFVLRSSSGQTVSLENFLGKQDVVLVFYMVAT